MNVCHVRDLQRSVHDFGAFRLVVTREPAHDRMARHAHDMTSVSVLLDGALVEEAEHRQVVGLAGSVVVKPAGVYHENRFGPTDVVICRVDILEHTEDTARFEHSLSRWLWRWRPRAFDHARAAFAAGSPIGHIAARRLAVELVAIACDPPTDARAPGWLRSASREVIASASVGRRRAVMEIASTAGRHRGSLARAFREQHGISIREYRRRAMVERAARAIVAERGTLSAVAHACGFTDHSHMTRAIRRVCGMTPSELRSLRS